MSESSMWTDHLKPLVFTAQYTHAVRVENRADPGMPDVNYCMGGIEGWIELKELSSWPQKPEAPVRIAIYTPQQRNWAFRRNSALGRCYFMLKVGQEWLLLSGQNAAILINKSDKGTLLKYALWHAVNGLGAHDILVLRKVLRR